MKKIILIGLLLLSFNAISEEFNFAEFESELAELEATTNLEDPAVYVDKISSLQSATDKNLETSYSTQEIYEIIPLPEMEAEIKKDSTLNLDQSKNLPIQKRVRSN